MPFLSFTTGQVLSSSDMNTMSKQSITTCTSSTRPSSPAVGTHIYETNTGNVLMYYGATTGWKPPWSQPWGNVMAIQGAAGAGFTTGTTEATVATGTSTTFVANRRYRWYYTTTHIGQVDGDLFQVKLKANNTAGTTYATQRFAVVGPVFQGITSAMAIMVPGATTFTPVACFQRIAGTQGVGTAVEFTMVIDDIGPSTTPPAS